MKIYRKTNAKGRELAEEIIDQVAVPTLADVKRVGKDLGYMNSDIQEAWALIQKELAELDNSKANALSSGDKAKLDALRKRLDEASEEDYAKLQKEYDALVESMSDKKNAVRVYRSNAKPFESSQLVKELQGRERVIASAISDLETKLSKEKAKLKEVQQRLGELLD